MKIIKFFIMTGFIFAFGQSAFAQKYPCLPNKIIPDTVVSATFAPPPRISQKVYVKDELKRLNARCSKKTLVDGEKREIKFYRLNGCWGKLPENAKQILVKQSAELTELRKKYTVITLTCNASGVPRM